MARTVPVYAFQAADGSTIRFAVDSDLWITNLTGDDGLDVEMTEQQSTGQTGKTITGQSVGSRSLTVTGSILRDLDANEALLKRLIRPKEAARWLKTVGDTTWYLDVLPAHTPDVFFGQRIGDAARGKAGFNEVDAYAVFGQFQGIALCQPVKSGLGEAVGHGRCPHAVGRAGADIDDYPLFPFSDHQCGDFPGQNKGSAQVYAEDAIPFGGGGIEQKTGGVYSGVVHQNVGSAPCLHDAGGKLRDACFRGKIGDDKKGGGDHGRGKFCCQGFKTDHAAA